MLNIIVCELQKLKRYSLVWVGVVAVFFAAALAVVQAEGASFENLVNAVIWNNFSLAFPFMIALIGGFIINREYTDHTWKAMLTVPVSFRKMLVAKLAVTAILTAIFSAFSFVCTLIFALTLKCGDISFPLIAASFVQILVMGLCNFLAVMPIIVFFSKKQNGFFAGVGLSFFYGFCGIFVGGRNSTDFYPVTAGLGLIGYSGQEGALYHPEIGTAVLLLMIALSAAFLISTPNYDEVMTVVQKKKRRSKQRV